MFCLCSGHLVCGLHHGRASHWTDPVSWHWSYPSKLPFLQTCLHLGEKAATETLIDLLAAKTSLAQMRACFFSPPHINAAGICDFLSLFFPPKGSIMTSIEHNLEGYNNPDAHSSVSRDCFKICHKPLIILRLLPWGENKKTNLIPCSNSLGLFCFRTVWTLHVLLYTHSQAYLETSPHMPRQDYQHIALSSL